MHRAGPRVGAADRLSLAASPIFAVMALLTATVGADMNAGMDGASALWGMTLMYLLMGTFHAAPWLKLISHRIRGARERGVADAQSCERPCRDCTPAAN